MTERLYYHDSFLGEFPATIVEVVPGSRSGIVLDRTAFYPTSGGQLFDTGTLVSDKGKVRVAEVAEDQGGRILHFVEATVCRRALRFGARLMERAAAITCSSTPASTCFRRRSSGFLGGKRFLSTWAASLVPLIFPPAA